MAAATAERIGANVEIQIEGRTLVIRCDLDTDLGPSKSGKNNNVASTGGNVPVGVDGLKLGLNLYKPRG